MSSLRIGILAIGVLAAAGCVHYQPSPLNPTLQLGEYRARRLDDSTLLAWVERWTGHISPAGWTDRQLAVAALKLRAELPRARADWRTAKAGERSAGGRPQPGVSADVERAVSGSKGQSPWVVALAGLLSLELGGKRGARMQEARARAAVAEADLTIVAWRTVMATRQAVLHLTLADSARQLASVELAGTIEVAGLERERFAESAVLASELYRTEAEVEVVRSAAAAAERDLIEARGSLAGALGVPPRSIDSIAVAPARSAGCKRLDALGMDSLQAVALVARPEIARSLAEYAIAEAQVKLRVAKQYPDLDLGPGFIWDQGVHRWTVALALPGLLAFRNRAPIVESETARGAAGARVLETQESVLRELALAGERCRGAQVMRAAADSQMATAARNLARARATYGRGESTKLDGALAGLAVIRAGHARRDAERDLMLAGWSLEVAAGEWGGTEAVRWPDPRDENGEEGTPQ
ncbi:MAG: TolC family protein [Gemmatimonadales bacterium]